MALSVRGTQPFSLTQYATPIQYHETLRYNMGIFAQDHWRINRFTVNYGVRLDYLNARVDADDLDYRGSVEGGQPRVAIHQRSVHQANGLALLRCQPVELEARLRQIEYSSGRLPRARVRRRE